MAWGNSPGHKQFLIPLHNLFLQVSLRVGSGVCDTLSPVSVAKRMESLSSSHPHFCQAISEFLALLQAAQVKTESRVVVEDS